MGFNDKFNVVRSQILNIEPLPTLAHVYGLVSLEERQQQLTTSKGNNLLEGRHLIQRGPPRISTLTNCQVIVTSQNYFVITANCGCTPKKNVLNYMDIQIGGKTIEKERVSQLIPVEH